MDERIERRRVLAKLQAAHLRLFPTQSVGKLPLAQALPGSVAQNTEGNRPGHCSALPSSTDLKILEFLRQDCVKSPPHRFHGPLSAR